MVIMVSFSCKTFISLISNQESYFNMLFQNAYKYPFSQNALCTSFTILLVFSIINGLNKICGTYLFLICMSQFLNFWKLYIPFGSFYYSFQWCTESGPAPPSSFFFCIVSQYINMELMDQSPGASCGPYAPLCFSQYLHGFEREGLRLKVRLKNP